jgi:hypothetical protein
MPAGQVVDTLSASEFMREVMQKISLDELDAIERAVNAKSELFQQTLARETIATLAADGLENVLRKIFSVRRRLSVIHERYPHDTLQRMIAQLLYDDADVTVRFQTFCDQLKVLDENLVFDFASELLHYTDPDRYWLWTRWMWDPQNETGALRLVTTDDFDLGGKSLAEIYMKVGEAIAFTNATGEAAGFTRIGNRRFGLDVFLACVYGIYTYTVLRMRMTQEFNKVMPQLPELARRLLGVWEKGSNS